jgi:hypothetical protein
MAKPPTDISKAVSVVFFILAAIGAYFLVKHLLN